MFTFPIYWKLGLTGLFLIGGVVLAFTAGFWYAFPILLIGLLLLLSYILLGTIQSAAQFLETQDFEACERRLSFTLFPKLLYKTNRAYYYLMHGSIAMQRQQYDLAETNFNIAQNTGLPSGNEEALVSMQLANIAAAKNNLNAAKMHLKSAEQHKVTDQNLKNQIKEFKKALAQNRASVTHRMSGRKGQIRTPGGKRRRPKMR